MKTVFSGLGSESRIRLIEFSEVSFRGELPDTELESFFLLLWFENQDLNLAKNLYMYDILYQLRK